MYCKNCGEQIDDKAVICPKCGVAQRYIGEEVNVNDAPSTGFAVLCFFFPIIGLILYLVWHNTSPLKAKSCGKGALIGFCVGIAISIIFTAFSTCLAASVLSSLA